MKKLILFSCNPSFSVSVTVSGKLVLAQLLWALGQFVKKGQHPGAWFAGGAPTTEIWEQEHQKQNGAEKPRVAAGAPIGLSSPAPGTVCLPVPEICSLSSC